MKIFDHRLRGLFVALVLVLAAGCGPSHPATVAVRGRITYGGGSWPQAGMLYFTAIEAAAGFPTRTGTAHFETDGVFTAMTWRPGDGLMPGRYRIAVECWKVTPMMGGPPPASYVPAKYRNPATSSFEVNIAPGDAAKNLEFDVPPEKM